MKCFVDKTVFVLSLLLLFPSVSIAADDFTARFHVEAERPWAGPEYWTNPMEDWRISQGRLEVRNGGANRNVHLLTRQLGDKKAAFSMSVTIGRLENGAAPRSVGFRVGVHNNWGDYRSAVFHGGGLNAGVSAAGRLFIGRAGPKPTGQPINAGSVLLTLTAHPAGDKYDLTLTAADAQSGKLLGTISKQVAGEQLIGNLVLVNHFPTAARGKKGKPGARHWFRDWRLSGEKIEAHPNQTFGPILWAMHTLSRGVMKMTAQMPPLGKSDSKAVRLQVKKDGAWKTIGVDNIDALSRTATFRIADWDDSHDTPYRLVYALTNADGEQQRHYWKGVVRRDPVERDLIVAGFTGNTDTGFPNADIVRNVGLANPDVLLFTGDQIYEQVGGYGIVRTPDDRSKITPEIVNRAAINYLRKWYMFGWAFGDLMRDRISLCLPDDHDVYQGNIWGNGGNPISMAQHERGGYAMAAEWVNMVHRTQTSHHPAAYDPTPIKQNISVYYGDMLYGRVSFAILADRQFKSGPRGTVATWPGRPDHIQDRNFDTSLLDKPGLKLLGARQLKFLREWGADWRGADMKVVCSQTILCNLANYHGGEKMYLVADLDSNGWPQAGRNRALDEIRRSFALMYAGDQHLPSIVQHGILKHGDAGYSFCVPSIAAGYPRSWRADAEGRPVKNRLRADLPNTGDYIEGLGNRVSVFAIGNPAEKNRPGPLNTLHDKSSGFGIVRFDKKKRNYTMECWRLQVDLSHPKPGDQFPGWPKTINMLENYGRAAVAHLPTLHCAGKKNPVVQVIDEANGKTVYTLRIIGDTFQPKVFHDGAYTIRVGQPETNRWQVLTSVRPDKTKTLEIEY